MKYIVTLNGKNYEVEVEKTEAVITSVTDAPVAAPVAAAPVAAAAPAAPAAPAAAPAGSGSPVRSPMPGTILSVSVAPGQQVKSGQVLMILEAMKMENEIVAPCDGTINQVNVQKGSTVETDAVLALIG